MMKGVRGEGEGLLLFLCEVDGVFRIFSDFGGLEWIGLGGKG